MTSKVCNSLGKWEYMIPGGNVSETAPMCTEIPSQNCSINFGALPEIKNGRIGAWLVLTIRFKIININRVRI